MGEQLPFFTATRFRGVLKELAFGIRSQPVYRVYVLLQELLFLEVGTVLEESAPKLKQLDEANPAELRRLAGSDRESFVASASELANLRLEAPPGFSLFGPYEHDGELCFHHPVRGKYRLLLYHKNAQTAYRELPKALGKKIAVNAVWSDTGPGSRWRWTSAAG